jgi:hypothetical protein
MADKLKAMKKIFYLLLFGLLEGKKATMNR